MRKRFVYALAMTLLAMQIVAAQQVPVTDFSKSVVVNAQDALTRLGYDIGTSDGQWGRRSREALNKVRAENGLPPADTLSGSSIALLHRLAPGPMTLPHPGILISDPVARRAWLMDEANAAVSKSQCPTRVGDSMPIRLASPVEVVQPPKLDSGAVLAKDDWYSPVIGRFVAADNYCLTGTDKACEAIIDTIGRWADADALRLKNPHGYRVEAEIPRWISNIVLRKMIVSYMVAKPLTPPDALRDASILDWFKRRIDENYFIIPDDKKISDPNSWRRQNHAVAAAQVPMLFGILSGDRSMLQPALDLRQGVLAAMRDDGSIPAEARRGGRWFHYSVVALGQLLAVGEWAAVQGIDVYADDANELQSVQNGIKFLFDGLQDFDVAIPYAKENHAAGESNNYKIPNVGSWMFGWLPAYRERFGNDANMQRIASQTVDPDMCSADALADPEKLHDPQFCTRDNVDRLTLADLILTQYPEPSPHMGYSAGCMQGSLPWNALVGKDGAPEWQLASLPFADMPDVLPEVPKPAFEVRAWQSQSLDSGTWINTLIGADLVGAPKGEAYVGFSIMGTYATRYKSFPELELRIDHELKGSTTALEACGMKVETLDDGRKFPVLSFRREDDTLVIKNAECALQELPKPAARMSRFILSSMQDIAIGMLVDGSISSLSSPYLADFMTRVARGEIRLQSR